MDKNKTAVDIFNKNANLYQDKFMDVNLYEESFDLFCSILKKDAKVLELACGPGNITKYLLSKRPDLKILGTDLAPNMVELAKKNNPTAEFKVMDCRDLNLAEKSYDAVMCGFCLPYLSKEEAIKLIVDASKLLKAGGILYISTMEDDYTKSDFKKGSTGEEIFMHYHQADYLTQAVKENKFLVIDLRRQAYPEHDGTTSTDMIIIAEK